MTEFDKMRPLDCQDENDSPDVKDEVHEAIRSF